MYKEASYSSFLNCRLCEVERNIMHVDFTASRILPNSPLFKIIQYRENKQISSVVGVDKITTLLGISNKRVARLIKMYELDVKDEQVLTKTMDDIISQTDILIAEIEKIENTEEKLTLAIKASMYIDKELQYLRNQFKNEAIQRASSSMKSRYLMLLQEFQQDLLNIESYKFGGNIEKDKLFIFQVPRSGLYGFSLKYDSNLGKVGTTVELVIDKSESLLVEINNDSWIDMGDLPLDKGEHRLEIRINNEDIDILKWAETDSSLYPDKSCYGAKLVNDDPIGFGSFKMRFKNPIAQGEEYIFYEINDAIEGGVTNLSTFEYQEDVSDTTEDLRFYDVEAMGKREFVFCGNTQEDSLSILPHTTQIYFPVVYMRELDQQVIVHKLVVDYTKINPTHYNVNVIGDNGDVTVVTLNERFDPDWELLITDGSGETSKVQNHFESDYYANSWLIQKDGDYKLEVRHASQRRFTVSAVISLFFAVSSGAYICYKKFVKKND